MAEYLSQLVVGKLPDETGAESERRQPRDGIGRRSSAQLPRRAHRLVQPRRLGFVDQPHRSLRRALGGDELVAGVGNHVDDGIADREHVEAVCGHSGSGFK